MQKGWREREREKGRETERDRHREGVVVSLAEKPAGL
jgi:hypothetical protein